MALGALLSVGGSLLGSIFAKDAAEDAAEVQAQASRAAIGEQRRQYDQTRADMMPWMEAGKSALAQLRELTKPGGDLMQPYQFEADPGYQFGLDEGMKAINNNMAARGMRKSGAAMKGLGRFATDYATTKYNEGFNRDQIEKNRLYGVLAGQSGVGQTTAGQVGQFGASAAGNIANYGMQGANATAAGIVGGANAINNGLNNVSGYYRMRELLKG